MKRILYNTKTTTKRVKASGVISMLCFASTIEDGSTSPEVCIADILQESARVNGVDGKVGELILSFDGENPSYINNSGELILGVNSDSAEDYVVIDQDLIYERADALSIIDAGSSNSNFNILIDGDDAVLDFLSEDFVDGGNA